MLGVNDPDYYEWETHIFFDDAMEPEDDGNDFVVHATTKNPFHFPEGVYSIAFGSDGVDQGPIIGDFGNMFFASMTIDSVNGILRSSVIRRAVLDPGFFFLWKWKRSVYFTLRQKGEWSRHNWEIVLGGLGETRRPVGETILHVGLTLIGFGPFGETRFLP